MAWVRRLISVVSHATGNRERFVMRTVRHDIVEALLLIAIYTAIGSGTLFIGVVTVEGFVRSENPESLLAMKEAMFWLALVSLGYFLGWTLTGLAVDYEEFWMVPGRKRSFDGLVARSGATDGLTMDIERAGSVQALLRSRNLRAKRLKVLTAAPLTFVYLLVRGAWLGGAVTSLVAVIDIAYCVLTGSNDPLRLPVIILVGSLVTLGTSTLLTLWVGSAAARQVAVAIRS